jgi:hypothetical protein
MKRLSQAGIRSVTHSAILLSVTEWAYENNVYNETTLISELCDLSQSSLTFKPLYLMSRSRNGVVGIATRYGLEGPVIESRWGRDFPHLSRPAPRPPSLLYNGYRVFPGAKTAGAWC